MPIRHLFYLCFFCTSISAQQVDSISIENWHKQSIEYLKNEKIDSFELRYKQVCDASKINDDLLGWVSKHREISRTFRQIGAPDTALFYIQKSYLKVLFRQPNTDIEWEKLGYLYIYAAYLENNTFERFDIAEKLYTTALEILVNKLDITDFYVARFLYVPLGEIYTKLGDGTAAETMFKKSYQIAHSLGQFNYAASVLSELSTVYHDLGETDKAIASCRQGLAMNIDSETTLGALNSNLAKALFANQKIEAAITHANIANGHFEKLSNIGHPSAPIWQAVNQGLLGSFFTEKKDFKAANSSFQKAELLLTDFFSNKYERNFAKHYYAWGMSKLAQNDLDGALQLLQQSLQSLLPSFKENNPLINPSQQMLYAENTFQDVLFEKASIFEKKFDQNGNKQYLIAALECHELIFEVEKLLRQSYYYESSKLFNVAESRERCGEAVRVSLKLADKTGDLIYKKKAFEFAERSKSILLLEYFMENDAQRNSILPDSVRQKEKSFQETIAEAEKQLYNLEINEATNSDKIQLAHESLFNLKKEYAEWMDWLENEFPLFYANKYEYSTIGADAVQEKLINKGEAILEYFVSDSSIYLFVFTKSDFNIVEIDKAADFEQSVINFHQSIEAYQYKNANRDSLCQIYTTLAQKLYRQLLQPAEKFGLSGDIKIVSSGMLAFLPFDALLTDEPENLCAFNEYPYALHKFNISYDYSLTLHERMQNIAPRLSSTYGGFAPDFSGKNGFAALNFNVSLIEDISKLWQNSNTITGDSSTIKRFQELVDKYTIVHLATHAEANMDAGNFSFIVFSDGNGAYDSLFVRDIYELRLLAEMVVLSACETAIGELHDGEGIISLARAFLQSGSRSAITTLWSINEGSNKNLMLNFYEFLAIGDNKNKALQRAKIKQTDNDNYNAHPVFWAAYTPYGQMNALVKKTTWWWYALGGIVLIFIMGLRFRKKNSH